MALDISQILTVSYPLVLADKRSATNQWAESALMREFDRQGMVKSKSLGPTIECPLDYRRNQGGEFLASDLATTSMTKTEIATAASYAVAELSVPIVWSKKDDAMNPSENQKIALAKMLSENAIETHDALIEDAIFATSTQGFLGVGSLIPSSGQGSPGGIDAATETFWRNYASTYALAGTNIEAALTTAHNSVAKGSGSPLTPSLIFMGATPHALLEAALVSRQRFVDVKEIDGGVKVLAFKQARCIFSQAGGNVIYGVPKKAFQLVVSKEYFRDKGKEQEIQNGNGFVSKVYSACQLVTDNKSRLFILTGA